MRTAKVPRLLYVRSLLPPVAFYLGFAGLLLVYLALAHGNLQPKPTGRMAWQANEAIQLYAPKKGGPSDGGSAGDAVTAVPDELMGESIDGALPLDSWNPLLPHRTGLTAVAVKACVFSPTLFGDICAPATTPEEDARLGKWVRVHKDLNKMSGLWWLSLYYRRSRRFDVPYITSVVVLDKGVPVPPGFILAAGDDLHSGAWPRLPEQRLAYKLRYPPGYETPDGVAAENYQKEEGDAPVDEKLVLTEIDVLYGDDEPWFGFSKVRPLILEQSKRHKASVGLVIRMGVPDVPKAPELRMSANGTFRILQVADLHYSVGAYGSCRDTPKTPCSGDVDTAELLSRTLDAEKPNLVVFTGDQLNGQETTWDAMSVLAKFAKPVIDRKIPWAATFGNHDAQDGTSKTEQMAALQQMPYSLCQTGPRSVDGVGNYLLKIYAHDASKIHLASVYVLDSGDYVKDSSSWNPFSTLEYDYIRDSQTEWYLSTSAAVKPVQRPFVPDGADDLGGIWKSRERPRAARLARQASNSTDVALRKPNALAFFHIPLIEHGDDPDLDPDTNVPLDVGLQYEKGGSSKINGGFFWHGLKQAFSGEYSKSGVALNEVKVVGNGHVHTSENCRRTAGIWQCFGGGSSYSGYGRKDLPRRFRVYDLSEYGERISTYKRTENDEIVDRMDLFGGDAAPIV